MYQFFLKSMDLKVPNPLRQFSKLSLCIMSFICFIEPQWVQTVLQAVLVYHVIQLLHWATMSSDSSPSWPCVSCHSIASLSHNELRQFSKLSLCIMSFSCFIEPQWVQTVLQAVLVYHVWGGWGCEVSCGGHHRPRGKTTTESALDGAVFDIAQILAYLVHNISRSQLYLGFGHFVWLPSFFSVNNILAGLWLNYISSVEITLFLLADILLQHRACFSVRV